MAHCISKACMIVWTNFSLRKSLALFWVLSILTYNLIPCDMPSARAKSCVSRKSFHPACIMCVCVFVHAHVPSLFRAHVSCSRQPSHKPLQKPPRACLCVLLAVALPFIFLINIIPWNVENVLKIHLLLLFFCLKTMEKNKLLGGLMHRASISQTPSHISEKGGSYHTSSSSSQMRSFANFI